MQDVLIKEASRAKRLTKPRRRGFFVMLGDWITGPLDKLFYLMMTEE